MALTDVIDLAAPTEQVSVSELPLLDIPEGGVFRFTVASNMLREGSTVKTLADGSQGLVKFITVTGEVSDLNTKQSLGKTSIKFFLNTRGNWLASNMAAVCTLYDKTSKHSRLIPVQDSFADGTVFYKIQDLNGKSFCVGLARGDDWTDRNGNKITQYECVGVLSDTGVSAAHYINGIEDKETIANDYSKLKHAVAKAIERKKERDSRLATQAMVAGGGVSAMTYDAGAVQAQFTQTQAKQPTPVDNGMDDLPF